MIQLYINMDKQYRIVSDTSLKSLEISVNELMKDNYEPIGSIVVVDGLIIQAMQKRFTAWTGYKG